MKIKNCPAGDVGSCLNEDLIEDLLEALKELLGKANEVESEQLYVFFSDELKMKAENAIAKAEGGE